MKTNYGTMGEYVYNAAAHLQVHPNSLCLRINCAQTKHDHVFMQVLNKYYFI